MLTLIFVNAYTSTQPGLDDLGNLHMSEELALAVSQVCQRWRNIALDTPSLWTNIILLGPLWDFELAKLYLHRSSLHPIDLFILAYPKDYPSFKEIESNVVEELLVPHLPRCRSIKVVSHNVNTDHSLLCTLFSHSMIIHFPSLERIQIEDNICIPEAHIEGNFSLVSDAPKLWHAILIGHGLIPYIPPLTNVTTLHLAETESILDVIHHCPVLETLWVYETEADWVDDHVPHAHPSLRSLCLFNGVHCVSQLLLYLIAPNLEELIIAPVAFSNLSLLHSRTDAGTPRFPGLKSLTMSLSPTDCAATMALAAHCFPNIETLILPYLYPRHFVEVFSQSIERKVFAELTSLAVREVDETGEAAISEVILRRKLQGRPLRKIFVDGNSYRKRLLGNLGTEVEIEERDLWREIESRRCI
ncbi:hypothetical protein BDQ12DRAFT_607069 [Crucibulum laeve]|uniref:F-box domain-containing protein n=1 Tax=Crucibulum laeve TaxID=68775 RepID=A0A5C3LXR8_9AGAR|nr:hypothetical protein BDQ12DRAFT_607069 [Crucibulum laeve]